MCNVANKFSVLKFPDLPTEELEKQTKYLCRTLTFGDQADLNDEELIVEIKYFPPWPKPKMAMLELLVFLEEKDLKDVFKNMWVALRVGVTTPVTVASAERSFTKLKLIKTYICLQCHKSTLMDWQLSA